MANSLQSASEQINGLLAGMSRELRCSICLNNFTNAVSTPCGHIFCRECIEKVLTRNNDCPLCNQAFTKRQLNVAASVQAIVDEFLKMREEFECDNEVNLSQLPIQYLSHEDTLEQNTPRQSLTFNNQEEPLSNIRSTSNEPRQIKIYLEKEIPDIDIPNMSFVSKIDSETTHVVLESDEHCLVEWSEQYMLGILYGCHIVDYKWLNVCIETNKINPEKRFYIQGDKKHGRTGAAEKGSTAKSNGKNQVLLKGFRAKFIRDDDISKRYKRYVKIGGGSIADHGEIIICSEDMNSLDLEELYAEYPDRKLLSKEWIDACICNYELDSKDKYIL